MSLVLDGTAGMTAPQGAIYNGIQSATAQATTSGTSITFSSIPSWVKRITVMFNGVSTNGTSVVQVQVGSGSVSTTGYTSYANYAGGANSASGIASTTGLTWDAAGNASTIRYGIMTITLLGSNTYISGIAGGFSQGATIYGNSGGGVTPALSGALDRVIITTVNGTDTFDAGSINILYE
jgi:hypothetical protein